MISSIHSQQPQNLSEIKQTGSISDFLNIKFCPRLKTVFWIIVALWINIPVFAQQKPSFLTDYNHKWVDSVFQSLTLDEKIGQLLMPRGNYSGKPHDVATLKSWVKDYKIGGIVYFAGPPHDQVRLTNELQELTTVPLMIGQDFEWGLGMRLDSTDRFPYAVAIGAVQGNDKIIEEMGKEIAQQCRRIGVHINYAPVVDVNNNPENPVINFRAYGADKLNVTAKSLAYMRGMQSQHILCTAKHFPGHGDTDVDSHLDLPLISHDIKRLQEIELYPFKKLIDNGLSGIMTAHLNIPSLEAKNGLASTFSYNIISKLLREEMKFEGLAFTDAMEMKGAIKNFPKGEAMVRALLAGNDVLETFMDVPETVEAIKKAIRSGMLSMEMIDNKVKKILKAKSWVGLDRYQAAPLNQLNQDLNTFNADYINQLLTEKSITCLNNELGLLPIINLNQKIAVLNIEGDSLSDFKQMADQYAKTDYFRLKKNAPDDLIDSMLSVLSQYDIVIAAFHLIDIRSSKNYGLNPSNIKLFNILSQKNNAVICILGNPFILKKVPALVQAKTLMMAYQQNKYTERVLPQVIFGGLSCEGKFPMLINDKFSLGKGLSWSSLDRLNYGTPEQVNINRRFLYNGLDSIIYQGLKQKAFPGCVLMVAKDSKVIFSKAYGTHTYIAVDSLTENIGWSNYKSIDDAMDNANDFKATEKTKNLTLKATKGMVKTDDVYDFASITKISASMLAVMQLMSIGKLKLDDTLGAICPSMKNSNKSSLKWRDLLTHRAGLQAWIPFWKNAIDTTATIEKALKIHPQLESKFIVTTHRPSFFKRLFGKKSTKTIHYFQSLDADISLWSQVLLPESRTWKPNIFARKPDTTFTIPVAFDMFLNKNYYKKILKQIADSPLDTTKKYIYSDLHFYLYPEMVSQLTNTDFNSYLQKTYQQIGANSLVFNPWKDDLTNVIPTEYDSIFRQQLLHGYVHDEGAALTGGISGHAGLFGNANDLMKIMQMYLQNGKYGHVSFINSDVISECTSYQFPNEKNRRGIGFDKKDFNPQTTNAPSLSSDSSFGHSGYTGTYTWVDPKYNIVYVFLSNRVNPSRTNTKISTLNIRPAIGDHIIKSITRGI